MSTPDEFIEDPLEFEDDDVEAVSFDEIPENPTLVGPAGTQDEDDDRN